MLANNLRSEPSEFFSQIFVEWTAQTSNKSFWVDAFNWQQRDKGCCHQVVVAALAFKWANIVHRCWQTLKPNDGSSYLMVPQLCR